MINMNELETIAIYLILISPIVCWFFTGCFKFLFRSAESLSLSTDNIGYGGFPSNHSSVAACTFTICFLTNGPESSGTIASFGLLIIVVIDALGLRNNIGKIGASLNKIEGKSNHREVMGHSKIEVLGGLIFGISFAIFYNTIIKTIF